MKISAYAFAGIKRARTVLPQSVRKVIEKAEVKDNLLDFLVQSVATYYGIPVQELFTSLKYNSARARHMIIWLGKQSGVEISWGDFQNYLQFKDRGQAIAGYKYMDGKIEAREEYRDHADELLPLMREWLLENKVK